MFCKWELNAHFFSVELDKKRQQTHIFNDYSGKSLIAYKSRAGGCLFLESRNAKIIKKCSTE